MEKYGAFRDKGSGIAPFFPVPTQPSGIALPFHAFLAFIRVPLVISFSVTYFLLFSWFPIGSLGKKAVLWCILGIPGIWWVDLQVDGVKRGMLGKNSSRVPHPGSVIAPSFTSPFDALYLAAIFDPLFARSFPDTRQVQQITLWQAIFDAFSLTPKDPPIGTRLVDLATLLRENPDRIIAVFPECTTTNGRGILPLSPCILTAPEKTKIFPISLKWQAADITTPVPGSYFTFIWNLCSKPTHTVRVRIAEATYNTSISLRKEKQPLRRNSYETNFLDDLHANEKKVNGHTKEDEGLTEEERAVLDRIGEALARLGRIKRVGLGVEDKAQFIKVWSKRR